MPDAIDLYIEYFGEEVYIDVEDEIEILKTEVAIHIAKRICVDKKLKITPRIFEEKQYRLEYIVELQKKLNISQKIFKIV